MVISAIPWVAQYEQTTIIDTKTFKDATPRCGASCIFGSHRLYKTVQSPCYLHFCRTDVAVLSGTPSRKYPIPLLDTKQGHGHALLLCIFNWIHCILMTEFTMNNAYFLNALANKTSPSSMGRIDSVSTQSHLPVCQFSLENTVAKLWSIQTGS